MSLKIHIHRSSLTSLYFISTALTKLMNTIRQHNVLLPFLSYIITKPRQSESTPPDLLHIVIHCTRASGSLWPPLCLSHSLAAHWIHATACSQCLLTIQPKWVTFKNKKECKNTNIYREIELHLNVNTKWDRFPTDRADVIRSKNYDFTFFQKWMKSASMRAFMVI